MRFAQFHPADDSKVRKPVAAPLHALQIPVQIHVRRSQRSVWRDERLEMLIEVAGKDRPGRVVGVLGESNCGEAKANARAHVRSIEPPGAAPDHSLCT
jgi:hypothetical protein